MKGFSILYKAAEQPVASTLITLLGMPSPDNWQDYLIRIMLGTLYTQAPNLFNLQVVNNEAPLIRKLTSAGLLTANFAGSLQTEIQAGYTRHAGVQAEARNKPPLDIITQRLNQNMFYDQCQAQDFLHRTTDLLLAGSTTPFIFDKLATSVVEWLETLADEHITIEMAVSSYAKTIILKNAIAIRDTDTTFTCPLWNNLVLLDTSRCSDDYMETWKFLDLQDYVGFDIIASNTDPAQYAQATPELLQDIMQTHIVSKMVTEVIAGR